MTLFDRALTKAYSRHPLQQPAPTATIAEDRLRGWVARVRVPRGTPAAEKVSDLAEPPELVWHWPEVCQQLLDSSAAGDLRRLAQFLETLPRGRKWQTIAFSGSGRGVGLTTLLLTLGRVLIEESDSRLLLVDADREHTDMAAMLGIELSEHEPAPAGDERSTKLDATLVSDRLALATLGTIREEDDSADGRAEQLHRLFARWRDEFDLVLIDSGPWESLSASGFVAPRLIDAVVGVRRFDRSLDDLTTGAVEAKLGRRLLGLVETFTPAGRREASRLAG